MNVTTEMKIETSEAQICKGTIMSGSTCKLEPEVKNDREESFSFFDDPDGCYDNFGNYYVLPGMTTISSDFRNYGLAAFI